LTILQALGFKADRDLGVHMLQTVHEHGGVRSPIAALVLLANYLFIPRALTDVKALLGHAGPIIRSSMVKYPYVTFHHDKQSLYWMPYDRSRWLRWSTGRAPATAHCS